MEKKCHRLVKTLWPLVGGRREDEGRAELGKERSMGEGQPCSPGLPGGSVLAAVGAVHLEETKSLL